MWEQIAAGVGTVLASITADFSDLPKQIEPSAYPATFTENFDKLDVTANGPSRWTAHTWWNGDFGDAAFTDPTPNFPFTVSNGVLTITASHALGSWKSGLLSTVDRSGRGFAQQYGYFEMRAKMPPGSGVWPGFWLASVGAKRDTVELDVVEYYGVMPDRYYASVHVWSDDPARKVSDAITVNAPAGEFTNDFHTYGVLVTPKMIGFYYDRRLKGARATPQELNRPMGVLVDLALGGGWPIDKAPDPSRMLVDYVKVWSLPQKPGF